MGNNDTKHQTYLHQSNDDSSIKSNSLKRNNKEQKKTKQKLERRGSNQTILKKNIEKYLEQISEKEKMEVENSNISNSNTMNNQNNEKSMINDNTFNNIFFDNNNNEITKSKSTSNLSQNDSYSQQSFTYNYDNSNFSQKQNNHHSDINFEMKQVFFYKRSNKKNNTVQLDKIQLKENIINEEYKNQKNIKINNIQIKNNNLPNNGQINSNLDISPSYSKNLIKDNISMIDSTSINIIKSKSNIYENPKEYQKKFPSQNDYELTFYRNGDEIRSSYLTKLICKKIWTPSLKPKTHNSLIIFDWDDTLLCTSFLNSKGSPPEKISLSIKETEKMAKLEFNVLRVLTLALEKGEVYIITNATRGWVEYSCEKYYPSVFTLMKNIHIISARGNYENIYPGDLRMWKIQTFLKMEKEFDCRLITNIICLGDNFIEIEAGHILGTKFSQAFVKTVKFREEPKIEELNKQLMLVCEQFDYIYKAVKNLTIRVEKKKK